MIFQCLINKLKNKIVFFYLFYLVLTILVSGNAFFWDTVQLASRHANFYYEEGLRFQFLPENMDSGHIPAFGYLLALCWKIFGRSLMVSHLFMLPFLFGIVFHAHRLVLYFTDKNKYWFLILILADPTLLAQSVLVTPDIPLIFFMLMLLNGIFYNKSFLKMIAVLGLSLISMRGWMVAALVFVFDMIDSFILSQKKLKVSFMQLKYYLPGGIIALVFILVHYKTRGWIGYHEDSPWAGSFEKVSLKEFIRNIFIYAWRLIDFGRIIWWIMLVILIPYILKQYKKDKKIQQLLILALIFLAIFPINMLIHKYLTQPRYFLPIYLIIALLVAYSIHLKVGINRMAILISLALLAGNFIIYPDKIAQGWDSTLAHLPYYKMRKNALIYMKEKKVDFSNTKCWFPNLSEQHYIDLSNDSVRFSDKDISQCSYCLYSNIYNDIYDNDYDEIMTWDLIYKQNILGVKMLLLKNPNK
jgi:hypothetical protein